MTRRLITAVAVVMAFGAATAYAAVTVIPPSKYPPGCHPNGFAFQGDAADNNMRGDYLRDLLRGGRGRDALHGNEGRDCLFGQRGGDRIHGAQRADKISGGRGDDRLSGGGQPDAISGGKGKDVIRDGSSGARHGNHIDCGKGFDKVVTNKQSKVAANCEHVTRR